MGIHTVPMDIPSGHGFFLIHSEMFRCADHSCFVRFYFATQLPRRVGLYAIFCCDVRGYFAVRY